ncbi:MAG: P-type DNA transfer ATPase VirB11 [Sphingobium sp.]
MNLALVDTGTSVTEAETGEGIYLSAYLEPFRPFLERPDVSEILVNRPGELWIESAGSAVMERIEIPAIDDRLLKRLAEQVARVSCQGISREQPLLAATLPDGARVQFVAPPATRRHWALSIRRHRMVDVPLSAWRPQGGLGEPDVAVEADRAADPLGWLVKQVHARRTILIAGGTSSGKTTFLNALLREVGAHERVILVEDTPEIRVAAPNALGLVAVRGEMGEARVTTDDLLQASLRLRPDRIVLGELRGKEAITFLRAINTGHPGSFSTIHANSCAGAFDQLALMVLQAGLGLAREDILAYARSVIDVVVQLGRRNGTRSIVDIRESRKLAGHAME